MWVSIVLAVTAVPFLLAVLVPAGPLSESESGVGLEPSLAQPAGFLLHPLPPQGGLRSSQSGLVFVSRGGLFLGGAEGLTLFTTGSTLKSGQVVIQVERPVHARA